MAGSKRGRPPGIRSCVEFDSPCWWTEAFVGKIGEIASSRQINAAKNYARTGHVIDLSVTGGLIEARVQGRRKAPYRVRLYSSKMSEDQGREIKRLLRERAIYRITLLSGEMPLALEGIFNAAGVPLSLESFAKNQQLCSCSEPDNICKHILAAAFVTAVACDRDPFLLLRFRGLEKCDLLRSLCAPEGRDEGSNDADSCWELGGDRAPIPCCGTEDLPLPQSPDSEFYGSADLPEELNDLRCLATGGGSLALVPDFPLWRGETSFPDSIAPYYRYAERFAKI